MSLPADVIANALAAASRGDEDARWDCVCALQREGTPAVLAAAVGLCESLGPEERALGADILGQLGGLGALAPYREQSRPALARLLEDPDPGVKAAAVRAHGHLWLQANIGILARLATDSSVEVRHAVAVALPRCGGAATVPLLIALMSDPDDGIRDWATFGLARQVDDDTPEIREALLERACDAHDDVRAEALVGLATRKDGRALPYVLRALQAEVVGRLAVEAACELADPALLPALQDLLSWWDVDTRLLADALDACRGESGQ